MVGATRSHCRGRASDCLTDCWVVQKYSLNFKSRNSVAANFDEVGAVAPHDAKVAVFQNGHAASFEPTVGKWRTATKKVVAW